VNDYRPKTPWMLFMFLFAIMTGLGSLIYTSYLVNILKGEERKKVEQWAEATLLVISSDSTQNIGFPYSIIETNTTVPVILTDESGKIIAAKNFDELHMRDPEFLSRSLDKLKKKTRPIVIDLENNHKNFIWYKASIILTQLTFYPYVQLTIILLFILVAYLAFSSSRKADDNMVWVSMSKETAHQLGTPTSSLAGWVEMLHDKYPEVTLTNEIALDVARLEKITERFSRIGSKPSLASGNIAQIISKTIDYLVTRSSSKVMFIKNFEISPGIMVPLNAPLFEWVIENVTKNAIDAMEGNGEIRYNITETGKLVIIDITDTGKGIPGNLFKKVFNAGYSTKLRGWGMGLSLAKRIIEEFHDGKIYVRNSEVGKGTCIRILMNKE
jgi:signal transduction histidine kinase